MSTTARRFNASVITALVVFAANFASAGTPAELIVAYEDAMAAFQSEDYGVYESKMLEVLAMEPGHPLVLRHAARAALLQGNEDGALDRVEALVKTGVVVALKEDPTLKLLAGNERFESLVAEMELNGRSVGSAESVYELEKQDWLPEGIAHDPVTGTVFIGSIRGRNIVSIDHEGKELELVSRAAGMYGVLGLRVDADRRHLWVGSAAMAGMDGLDEDNKGKAALYCVDVDTGAVIASFELDNNKGQRNLNDVVVTRSGDAYVTESMTGALYHARADADEMEEFIAAGELVGPNGLVLSEDESEIYVSQYSLGIALVDIESQTVRLVRHGDDVNVVGIDGLYRDGHSLIGIQNGLGMMRVARFSLNENGDAITGSEVLVSHDDRMDDPTTGTIMRDRFVFIANSQLTRVNHREDTIQEPEQFDPSYILSVKLR